MTLNGFLDSVGDMMKPTTHADASNPNHSAAPSRHGVSHASQAQGSDGVEVNEHDIVRGEMQLVYACHCPCGKRWFDPAPEQLQVCRKCGRPVLLQLM